MPSDRTTLSIDAELGERFRLAKKMSQFDTHDAFLRFLLDTTVFVGGEARRAGPAERQEASQEGGPELEDLPFPTPLLQSAQDHTQGAPGVEILRSLRERDMVKTNQVVVQQLLDKLQAEESLSESDLELLHMVTEIESSREEGDVSTAIVKELFRSGGELESSDGQE